MTKRSGRGGRAAVVLGAALMAVSVVPGVAAAAPSKQAPPLLPIVFVHGNSGSAAQFETQFQRFTSNGYPQELLFAYEYDTSGSDNTAAVAGLAPFIDGVLDRTGADQVLLAAHSRGTAVSQTYLADPAQAAEVARYVNLDGRSAPAEPGGVPTLAVWGEWQSPPTPRRGTVGSVVGAENLYNPDLGHTETVSSARTFGEMYEFFTGSAPRTTDVVPEPPGQVTVAGRAVLFPENQGFAGATLQLWRVDPATGRRATAKPEQTFAIGTTGAFGPVKVNGRHTYEFALVRPDGSVHHFYQSPYTRSDHFVRLNSALTGTGLERFVPRSEQHVNVSLIRAREIWGDQGAASDSIRVDVLGDAVAPLEVATPVTTPRSSTPGSPLGQVGEVNALFLTDVGPRTGPTTYGPPDRSTDLSKGDLFPFNTLTFLNGVDAYLPSSPQGREPIRIEVRPRGGGATEVITVPGLASTADRISVTLRDSTQSSYGFPAGR
ncbi:alpha/beta hydrolase [Blastococcus sp. TF02A-35]|uniref:alpha/beta hydrolase n=1 Tax=Blastococcus sp. TF02A-35 TaxID=2559612 RepID=UPI00107374FA|nr:alpha/beta hydrolase [Blastococcus sp. TF02A_35]TFV44186.1 alpha/beta hydrolase [Blastococcus sp. TF02A_35]